MRSFFTYSRNAIQSLLWRILPIIAIGMSVFGLIRGQQTSETLEKVSNTQQARSDTLKEINNTMEEVSNTLQARGDMLKEITNTQQTTSYTLVQLNERIDYIQTLTEWSWAAWSISSDWRAYFAKTQRMAASSNPRYVVPVLDRFELTAEGRDLLETQTMDKIISMLQSNKDLSENVVVINLGIDNLDNLAKVKGVKLEVMIGTVVTYTQELKQATIRK